MITKKKGLLIVTTILTVLLIGLLGAKPIYFLYRDVSFYWGERTAAEKEIKAEPRDEGVCISVSVPGRRNCGSGGI